MSRRRSSTQPFSAAIQAITPACRPQIDASISRIRRHVRCRFARVSRTRRRAPDPHIQPVNLVLGDVVCEAGGFLEHVYFPKGAVLSLLTVLANGAAIETANIGNEGAFGLFAAMYSRTSFNQCLVQLQGGLVRVPIEILRAEFERSDHVRNLLVSYSETQLAQVQQTAACNSMQYDRTEVVPVAPHNA